MQCNFAKHNPVIMDQAIAYYLAGNKGTFTFMSLWNDDEPYPKDELLDCLVARLGKVKALYQTLPSIETEAILKRLTRQFNQLKKG